MTKAGEVAAEASLANEASAMGASVFGDTPRADETSAGRVSELGDTDGANETSAGRVSPPEASGRGAVTNVGLAAFGSGSADDTPRADEASAGGVSITGTSVGADGTSCGGGAATEVCVS